LVDPERVRERLGRLDALLARLETTRRRGPEAYLASVDERLRTERALQLALQICLDVGAHLISELGLQPPDEYRETFPRLADAGVLEPKLAARLADAAGLRNRLVHGYADLDDAQVFSALEGLDDLRAFALAAATAARAGGTT
jgi:uncharacterized protein YutE (UPF0331/DUF86 family)